MKGIWVALGLSCLVIASIVGIAFLNISINFGDNMKEEYIISDVKKDYNSGYNYYSGANAFVDNGKVVYVNSGSSSCPPVIEKFEKIAKNSYQIHVKAYGNRACTMDMRPIMQTVEKSNGKFTPRDNIIIAQNSAPEPYPQPTTEPNPEPFPNPTVDPDPMPNPPTTAPTPEQTLPPQPKPNEKSDRENKEPTNPPTTESNNSEKRNSN